MKVTLGGERLGAGKKQKVELRNYERSTHDLSYLWRSSMAAGTLVPFMSKVALPGDTWDIELNASTLTHPTLGPLFGSFKEQYDIFECPIRLYHAWLHNNKLGIGNNMSRVKLPILRLTATKYDPNISDLDNTQINPSHIASYLGIRGVGIVPTGAPGTITRDFNALPFVSYCDIYKNYYANKQEEIGVQIHTERAATVTTVTSITILSFGTLPQQPAAPVNFVLNTTWGFAVAYTGATPIPNQIIIRTDKGEFTLDQLLYTITDSGTSIGGNYNLSKGTLTCYDWRYKTANDLTTNQIELITFPLSNIDDMREEILMDNSGGPLMVNIIGQAPYSTPFNFMAGGTLTPMTSTQEGLLIKTYQSDLLNNWINTEWIDGTGGISEITAIDTSGGSFTIDKLNLAKKVYDMLNRIALSGGTYDDWLDTVYTDERYLRCETPMYHGGLSKELIFQEVISNAATNIQSTQPLGTLAGRGAMSHKHKGGKIRIKVNEPSYIIGIVSRTPRIDYSQGNDWDTYSLFTMDDLHKPALDEIGFQDLITEQAAWWDTQWDVTNTEWVQKAAGKQPAWINYMTSINKTFGNFAILQNEMFMTLNRRYENDGTIANGIKDMTTYIDPSKYNFIFAQTSLDSQNFWTQIAVNITVRRKMSAKVMPNL